MKTHRLKLLKKYADLSVKGLKHWELRKNDRDFQVGDELEMIVIDDETKEPTGNTICASVGAVFQDEGFGLEKGYCIISFGDYKPENRGSEIIFKLKSFWC